MCDDVHIALVTSLFMNMTSLLDAVKDEGGHTDQRGELMTRSNLTMILRCLFFLNLATSSDHKKTYYINELKRMYSRLELEGSEECFMGADGKGAYEMSVQQNDIEEQEFLAVACIKVGNLLNAMINRIVVGRYLVVSHSATSTTATTR